MQLHIPGVKVIYLSILPKGILLIHCSYMYHIDGFHGAWLHFQKSKSGCVFSAAMCKKQASKALRQVFIVSA